MAARGSGMEILASIVLGIAVAATPLALAALGELVAERAGVINLGLEGMMILGALAGFAALERSGSLALALAAAMLAGMSLALVFAVLTQTLFANQIASGLAVTLLGLGVTALLGQPFAGHSSTAIAFGQPGGILLALALTAAISKLLWRSRPGLVLRAAGENPGAADAMGYPVTAIRFGAILFGGALAGFGGAFLSLVQTPLWTEGMTAGRGWIALALVVFSGWRPWRLLAGAYLFGGVSILQLNAQAAGISIPAQYLSMLPYLSPVFMLVLISHGGRAPAALGKPFYPPR